MKYPWFIIALWLCSWFGIIFLHAVSASISKRHPDYEDLVAQFNKGIIDDGNNLFKTGFYYIIILTAAHYITEPHWIRWCAFGICAALALLPAISLIPTIIIGILALFKETIGTGVSLCVICRVLSAILCNGVPAYISYYILVTYALR